MQDLHLVPSFAFDHFACVLLPKPHAGVIMCVHDESDQTCWRLDKFKGLKKVGPSHGVKGFC